MNSKLKLFRRVTFLFAGGFSATYVVAKGLNAESEKKKFQLKIGNEDLPVPKEIQNLIDEVKQDMKLKSGIKVTPYMTRKSDVKSNTYLFGREIFIGIPRYFIYDEDNNKNFTAVVDEKEIPQDAPEFLSLKHSMCLSREAKKFAIAFEICSSQSSTSDPHSLLPVIVSLYCNLMSFVIQKCSDPSKLQFAVASQFGLYLLAPILYITFQDLWTVFNEFNVNLLAAELGKSYTQGGIEYYTKMIQKNRISKALNKRAPYSEDGDVIMSKHRIDHLPLQERITCLEEISKGRVLSAWEYVLQNRNKMAIKGK